MKKNKLLAVLMCLALAAVMFASCAASEEPLPTPEAETVEQPEQPEVEQPEAAATDAVEEEAVPGDAIPPVTDMLGNTVFLPKVVETIVSLTPAGTEIVYALGAGDRLVGVDAYSNYPEEAQSLEIVGDFNGPDVEKIVALSPDVILSGNTLQQEALDNLADLDMTVVCVEATTFGQIPDAIELVGRVTGKEDVAKALEDQLADAAKQAEGSVPAEAPTVYYAMSYGDAGNWTSGPGSFLNTMIEMAGGTPVVNDPALPPWVEFPIEDLVAANPDIILVDQSMGAMGDIATATGYTELDAVKNGKVYPINADVFTRPGPRVIEALSTLSDIVNGSAAPAEASAE